MKQRFCAYAVGMKLLPMALLALAASGAVTVDLAHEPGLLTRWFGNHLVDLQGSQTAALLFRIYNRDGSEGRLIPFAVEGALHIAAVDFSMNASGHLALVGHWQDLTNRQRHFLALIEPSGAARVIPTGAYAPSGVALEKSGDTWTFGSDGLRDSPLLRRWTPEGEMAEGLLRIGEFRLLTGMRDPGTRLIATQHGLYLFLPTENRVMRVEHGEITADVRNIGLTGGQLGRDFAVTEGGAIFSSATGRRGERFLVRLDISARRWFPTAPVEGFRQLYGTDGAMLVGHTMTPFGMGFWELPR